MAAGRGWASAAIGKELKRNVYVLVHGRTTDGQTNIRASICLTLAINFLSESATTNKQAPNASD